VTASAPGGDAPIVASVRPEPEPGVLAAIVAAVEECWPRPEPPVAPKSTTPVWRFSGRWWAKPSAARRDRPWLGGTR
jgi:hypothetical protein